MIICFEKRRTSTNTFCFAYECGICKGYYMFLRSTSDFGVQELARKTSNHELISKTCTYMYYNYLIVYLAPQTIANPKVWSNNS